MGNLIAPPLVPELVEAARRNELERFDSKGALRSREEAKQRQGKQPITVKWVDVN